MSRFLKVPVAVHLDPIVVLVLDAIAAHLSKSRDETIADALRLLFAALPRPDDAAPLERDHEIEASKSDGGAT